MISRPITIPWNILLCLILYCASASGQEKRPDNLVSLSVKNMPLSLVLSTIEKQTSYRFAYSSDVISKQKKITIQAQNMPINKLLTILLKSNSINYSIIDNQIILQKAPAPRKVTISGYIKDGSSGESLPGANVYASNIRQAATTNNYSFYSLTTKETDKLDLTVSYEGYEKLTVQVNARKDVQQNFNLVENKTPQEPIDDKNSTVHKNDTPGKITFGVDSVKPSDLEVIISDSLKKQPVSHTSSTPISAKPELSDSVASKSTDQADGKYSFNQSSLINNVNGNGDVMNSIQMMPGVIAGLDNTKGFFVRGGNADQNLVLLDEAVLYNPGHFFGLVSTFNEPAINSGTLLKDGIPSSYGDRLSSVLDISMKEGNNQQIGGDIQIGTTASGLTFYGPIVTSKSSYLLSVRHSTMDLWLRPLQTGEDFNSYHFYDVNAKINYQLSQNNRVFLSLYQGRDNSSYKHGPTDTSAVNYGVEYGNQALALRWNHVFSPKVFSNTSIVYSNYFQSISATQKPYYAQLYSGIKEMELKTDISFYPIPAYKFNGGVSYLIEVLTPASVSDKEMATGSILSINPSDLPEKHYFRLAAYLGNDVTIGQRIKLYLGARFPMFSDNNVEYISVEPRFSALLLISPSSGIKTTYTQTHQYLHQIGSYNASFPAEVWIGSSKSVKPENSQQVTFGVFKNSNNNVFEASIELFYKQMGNQLLFKGGVQPTITSDFDNMLVFGKGNSYGTEFYLQKVKGKLTGGLSYTYSFANQQFDSLNLGKPFPFANDRRHCLYLAVKYAFNQHWEISSNLIVTSGRTFTLKSMTSSSPGSDDPLYGEVEDNSSSSSNTETEDNPSSDTQEPVIVQNNYRLNPYNRLDINVSYKKKFRVAGRILDTEWLLTVYNVYARSNTFFAYRSINPVNKQPVVNQVSFLPIFPSFTVRLKF